MGLSKQAVMQGVWDLALMAGCGALCIVGSQRVVAKALAPLSAAASTPNAHAAEPAKEKSAEHAAPEGGGHGEAAGAATHSGFVYPLKTTVVNLSGDSNRHFAKVSLTLEAESEVVIGQLKDLDHKVYDAMIEILGETRAQEVGTDAGKEALKQKIRARLNRLLPEGGVRSVYLTEFLVQ